MDRSRSSAPQHSTAVRTAGGAALDLLLPAAAGERGEPAADASARRAVPEAPVLREPQDGRQVGGEPQTRPTADAHSGQPRPIPHVDYDPLYSAGLNQIT